MLMTQCKRDVTPLLTHWSYVSCALSYWCVAGDCRFQSLTSCIVSTNLLYHCLYDVDDSMQKRHNSIANALELRLLCIKLLMCCWWLQIPEFDNLYSRCIYEPASITASMMSMTQCKRDITPLLTHWSYVSCALSYQCVAGDCRFQSLTTCIVSTNLLVSLLVYYDVDDSMQKRCNSIANALELRLLCIKLLMCCWWFQIPEFDKLYSIYEPASITASILWCWWLNAKEM